MQEKDENEHLREAKVKELSDINEELSKRLNEEQERCRSLELQVEKADATAKNSRLQLKDLMKKETENAALKNKIARQEAYLQRLLQKQKGHRKMQKVPNGSITSAASAEH